MDADRDVIPTKIDINQHSEKVKQKQQFGALEKDTIIGKNHEGATLAMKVEQEARYGFVNYWGKKPPH